MKRIVIVVALVMCAMGLKAQDCDAIMLSYFKGNVEQMELYKSRAPEKFAYRCAFSSAAFMESDTIPAGVTVYNISEVKEMATGKQLSQNFVVDLNTLSYYAYNFSEFQMRHKMTGGVVCFSTPKSAHPYLVIRSIHEMGQIANKVFEKR